LVPCYIGHKKKRPRENIPKSFWTNAILPIDFDNPTVKFDRVPPRWLFDWSR
jgi:hypothetical protein